MAKVLKCYRCQVHKKNPSKYTFAYHHGIAQNKVCDDCMTITTQGNRYKCQQCDKSRRGKDYIATMRFGMVKAICAYCRNPNRKEDRHNKQEDQEIMDDITERSCLSCDKKFYAPNRFIRRCDRCKSYEATPSLDMWE